MSGPREDVELGDLEDEAFLPNQNGVVKRGNDNVFIRWLPKPIRGFLKNLSRMKLMLLILGTFIAGLIFLGYINRPKKILAVPAESAAASVQLTKDLSGTAIPEYVLTYAPLVFLDTHDLYFPSDLAIHLKNTHPEVNFTKIDHGSDPLTLENLDSINNLGGKDIFLTSNDDVTQLPDYLHGNLPDSKTLKTVDARSCAVVVADKGNGIKDAFYMYFYTFNQGPSVSGHELGDHLGDWEHNMIRFENGQPKSIWYSQHEYGAAYTYDAVEKIGKRPIAYSAKGSHANYAVPGKHDLHETNEAIPAQVVYDVTSNGPLWDPTLSAYYYTFSADTKKFTSVKDAPVNYLYFQGQWGDQEYGDDHPGQLKFMDYHKWTSGPTGPLDKHLDREEVCLPVMSECTIKSSV